MHIHVHIHVENNEENKESNTHTKVVRDVNSESRVNYRLEVELRKNTIRLDVILRINSKDG